MELTTTCDVLQADSTTTNGWHGVDTAYLDVLRDVLALCRHMLHDRVRRRRLGQATHTVREEFSVAWSWLEALAVAATHTWIANWMCPVGPNTIVIDELAWL